MAFRVSQDSWSIKAHITYIMYFCILPKYSTDVYKGTPGFVYVIKLLALICSRDVCRPCCT